VLTITVLLAVTPVALTVIDSELQLAAAKVTVIVDTDGIANDTAQV
jgi:hypothetical protein